MISIILPYWNRPDAARKALDLLAKQYGHLNGPALRFEVVIVCDGCERPEVPGAVQEALQIVWVDLPRKDGAKSPVTAWNAGVEASAGDVIVLSCVEILHLSPVLEQLAAAVDLGGPDAYVMASAYCPEAQEWHCHSTARATGAPEMPAGFGRAFCAALHRELYERAGGFDENYREGAGWEDIDFAKRLKRAGAKPTIRDDLMVIHPKTGATIEWGAEKFMRNEAIFRAKWTTPVTFVCLKAGTAFGPEYVNILRDMVARNLPLGYPGRFVCITDDVAGLDDGIETLPLPDDLEKWWGKLYMFKRGLFPDGSRLVFLDLDTVIVGSVAQLANYRGRFATLRDFYHPKRMGPAIICWEAGAYAASIWDQWVNDGKPRHPMGDLWWLNNMGPEFVKNADLLQDLFPGEFRSFKAHCHPVPPKGTKVVCFHGQPRPHNCDAAWVRDVWKIGGGGMADLEIVANTDHQKTADNVRANITRALPWLEVKEAHAGHAVIVGGGPSVAQTLSEIRWRQNQGHLIVALGGAARYLQRNGILADCQVLLDARTENVKFVLPEVPAHFVCSQCDPSLFETLAGRNVTMYHVNTAPTLEVLAGGREAHLISTGSTVGLIAMGIFYTQGYRNIHLYGMDSSYTDKARHHAYEQKINDADRVIEAVVGGRTFTCAPWMVAQVEEFQQIAIQLMDADCTITVAGEGLLPHVARMLAQPEEIAA